MGQVNVKFHCFTTFTVVQCEYNHIPCSFTFSFSRFNIRTTILQFCIMVLTF